MVKAVREIPGELRMQGLSRFWKETQAKAHELDLNSPYSETKEDSTTI